MSKKIIKVTRDQVLSARALIELRGGPEKVDPVIAKIAQAQQPRNDARGEAVAS